MNHPPIARLISLAIICLLIGPAFSRASDAPEPQPQSEPTAVHAATPIVETDTAKAEEEPAPIGIDRSGWPVIRVSPADGTVTHHPHYMGEPPMSDDEVNPLHAPDPVWQIQEALLGASANNLNRENLIDLAVRPIIGLARIIAIPVFAILDNPLSEATSP